RQERAPTQMEVWRLVATRDEYVSRIVDGLIPSNVQFFLWNPDVDVRTGRPDAVLAVSLPHDTPDAPTSLVFPVAAALEAYLDGPDVAAPSADPGAPSCADRIEVLDLDLITGNTQALADAELLTRNSYELPHPEFDHRTSSCRLRHSVRLTANGRN